MSSTKNHSEKSKSHITRFVIAVLFLAMIMLVIFRALFNVSRENLVSIGHLNAEQMSQGIEYYLIEESDEIALAAQTVEVMQDMGRSDKDILEYLTFQSRIVSETIDENYTGLYGYINGKYMDGSGWTPEAGYEPKERPWYQDAIRGNGKVVYVTPYIDSQTGTVMLSICKMLPDRKSVVSLDVSMDRIQAIVESEQFADYDQIFVTDKDYIIVAALDKETLGEDISDNSLILAYQKSKQSMKSNGYFEYHAETGKKNAVFASMVGEQWNVFLVKRSNRLMSSLINIYLILVLGITGFVFFVTLIFDYLNKRRNAAENLNLQLESLADIYISVHKIDIEKDKSEEIRCMPYIREHRRLAEKDSANIHEVLEKVMKGLVRDEYWEDMKAFIDFDTLDIRVGDSHAISLEFLGIHGWVKARILVLERKNDKITSFLWLIENIDEEKRKQSELRYLSETDLMTGLRNRGCGERLIKEQLEKHTSGMFCLIDADHFKSINDHYGHAVGDAVIKAIADCMKSSFAASDIVLRLGGDEFAAFAEGIESEMQAEGVIHRFLNTIDQIDIPSFSDTEKVEISIGISFAQDGHQKSFEEIYKEADKAVYESKKHAGSCVTYYQDSMQLSLKFE